MRNAVIGIILAIVMLFSMCPTEAYGSNGQCRGDAGSGPIYGRVTFRDGPSKGKNVTGAVIVLYNSTGSEIGRMTSNKTGLFSFDDLPFDEEYELRVTPPENAIGVINKESGYLFWDGSGFTHPLQDNGSYYNVSLAYYVHIVGPSEHPKVSIKDQNGQPVKGALVAANVPGLGTLTDLTDRYGIAVFLSVNSTSLPEGTSFNASRDGYSVSRWVQGAEVPELRKDSREDDILLSSILLIVIIAILLLALGLILSKGPPGGERSNVTKDRRNSYGNPKSKP